MPSRSALGAMSLGARASCPHRAEGPQGADRSDTPEPATPPEAPNAVEVGLGCTAEDWHWRSPRAWASCPHLADVPAKGLTEATRLRGGHPPPALPNAVEVGLGNDVPGSAGILPASGRRPAKCRQERHARVTATPRTRGAQCRRGRPWERCPWERGPLARNGPKARKAPTGATRPSGSLPRPGCSYGRDGVSWSAGVSPAWPCGGPSARLRAGRPRSQGVALPPTPPPEARPRERCPGSDGVSLGARASCPHRAEGPQSADRSDTPEPATPPPETPNAVEVGLGCTAEDVRWRSPRARASGPHRAEGPQSADRSDTPEPAPRARGAQCRRGRPWERCPWERGPLARNGPKARKAPTGATPPSRSHPRPSGSLPRPGCGYGRDGVSWSAGVSPACSCGGPVARLRAGRPRSQGVALGAMGFPESVGVARLAMWRACGPLAGGTPALPGCGLGSDGVSRERGRRPLGYVAGLWPACGRDARAPRGAAETDTTSPAYIAGRPRSQGCGVEVTKSPDAPRQSGRSPRRRSGGGVEVTKSPDAPA